MAKRADEQPQFTHDADLRAHLADDLRDDVRRLGEILGRVIAADRGADFLATIETIREYAKAARSTDTPDWASLGSFLAGIDADDLVQVARAFNQFLNLANIAEQIQLARQPAEPLTLPDHPALNAAVKDLRIELVLTAHPTEVLRRTLIQKYDAIGAALAAPTTDDATLARLIAESWHSDEIRQTRPTPVDEAKWGFAVVEQSLWYALPATMRKLDAALAAAGATPLAHDANPVTFASWMGGDRDGNPNVTAAITAEVLMLARWMAADLFTRDLEALQASLSMTRCTAALQTRLAALGDAAPTEPYRALMKLLRERMERTRQWAAGLDPTPPSADAPNASVFLTSDELLNDLRLAHDSLVASGMAEIADGPLLDTIRRAATFGVTLTSLDIRQSSDQHTLLLDELTQHLDVAGDGSGYDSWSEAKRQAFLLGELSGKRPLFPPRWQPSAAAAEVWATCRLLAQVNGAGVTQYVISMAGSPSDVLAVILLLREAGMERALPIVPLFETLDDLVHAPATLAALLDTPWYLNYCGGAQQVMIGYSDSAKDAGQLAAAWAQYLAQEQLAAEAQARGIQLTLFHGRGGAVGRGGGPAQAAVRSQPPGTVNGRLRVTEQGEMIRWKLGSPELAITSLTGYLGATLEATLDPPVAAEPAWRTTMTQLAETAVASYRAVVRDDPVFVELFRELTPEQELGILALGSRPARRTASNDVASLRAIPWVFAWTQVRLMLPAWLGSDSALANAVQKTPEELRTMMRDWPFFRMQIDMLEMVLAKADPTLTRYYASRLADPAMKETAEVLAQRLEGLVDTVLRLRETPNLLEHDPKLAASLAVRNTYLDPLHLLQAELLARYRAADANSEAAARALQVTMAGIASGLRNTG